MTQRADALANRFENANAELISFVEACSDADWRAQCLTESWTVAAAAHHIAIDHPLLADLARRVFTSDPMPQLTMEAVHEMNLQHAKEYASCTKAEVLDLLRRNGEETMGFILGLTDEQLDRTAVIPWWGTTPVAAEQVVDELIHHIPEHFASIRASVAATAEVR